MAKSKRVTKRQFNKIVKQLEAKLLPPEKPGVVSAAATDCEALQAFIEAAQTIYFRNCSIVISA